VKRNAQLALTNNELAGVARAAGRLDEADLYEKQADQFTPSNGLYHWVLGRRLQDLGMIELAEKHLKEAKRLGVGNGTPDGR
jgi:tetratricopeptide (TPR) repeat protein